MFERRFTTQATLRAVDPGGGVGPTIEGYAARFGVCSHDLGGWVERIQPGAFTRSLQSDRDVVCLVNHDNNKILGRRSSKTLHLNADNKGLHFRCELPDTTDGRDIAELLKRKDISECSFAFQIDDGGDDWTEEDRSSLFLDDDEDDDCDPDDPECDEDRSQRVKVRTLRSVKLFDVSVVTQPAYPKTSVGLNALAPQALGRSYTQNDYFPQGIPAEVRSHIGTAVLNPRVQERRRRLTNLFL
jgi:HK97 family phage prohead protease